MAKIVIAGQADCPYYARAELLGDKLAINLPDFHLHKIVKTPTEWKEWLSETCDQRGWKHDKSPLVWRELIDRGGKGVLIGGANEFQEYAQGYYGIESKMVSSDMRSVAGENLKIKNDVDAENAAFKALSQPVHVCVTNASSGICYALIDSLCKGEVLGSKVEMVVHLIDSSCNGEYMSGLQMEVEDLAYGLMRGIVVETDANVALKDCSYAVFLDDIERGEKSKDEWIKENHDLFVKYAQIIDKVAKKTVKVLIAGTGPVNFNAYMMIKNAPSIPRQNIVAMSRMVEIHSKSAIAERLNVNTACVVDMIVWGNPNGLHHIDVSRSRVHEYDGAIIGPDSYSVSGPEMVFDKKWLQTEFLEIVKNRQSIVEKAMRHPVAFCVASAINSTLMHWCSGSPSGQMFSLGVCSDGWYGVPDGLVFSFPVTFHPKGYWNVVQDIDLPEETKAKIQETIQDLESEIEVIFPKPKPPQSASPNNLSGDGADKTEEFQHEVKTEGVASTITGETPEIPEGETSAGETNATPAVEPGEETDKKEESGEAIEEKKSENYDTQKEEDQVPAE